MPGRCGMRIWNPAAALWPMPVRSCAALCARRLPAADGTAARGRRWRIAAYGNSFRSIAEKMHAIAAHYRHRLHETVGRYRDARRSLHTPASAQSRRGLDWMNFFVADVQTGFGTFVAFYLAELGWSPGNIGIALAVGGLAGVLSQIPGGALADAVTWKRGLAAIGIVMTAVAALLLALWPNFAS